MALIVEDGSIVANANSYLSEDDLREYAAARGVTLPADDAELDILSFKAMDYLNTLLYAGRIVEEDQPLPFPRKLIWVNGYEVADDAIPQAVKDAQAQLVMAVHSGIVLLPPSNTGTSFVKKQKVGPLEKEFSEAVYLANGNLPNIPIVDKLLAPYLYSGGFALRSVRV